METSSQDKSDEMSNEHGEFLIKGKNDEYKTEKCRQKNQSLDLQENEETSEVNVSSDTKKFLNPEILNKPLVVSSSVPMQCTDISIPLGIENFCYGQWEPLVLSSSRFGDNFEAKLDKSIEDDLKTKLDKSIEDDLKTKLDKSIEDDLKEKLDKSIEDDLKEKLDKSIEDDLKEKLDKSITDTNDAECERLLEINTITKTLPIIVPCLDRAIISGNKKIVKVINSYISSNSSEIVSNFYKQYEKILKDTSVWMGKECSCSKTDTLKYEEKICDSSKLLLVVEPKTESKNVQMENFQDFPIKVITTNSSRRKESKAVAEGIKPELHPKLDRVPKSVAKRLFKKHSNLTMVCPSAYKSIGFGSEERSVSEINCISLFCRVKGIIPIGEYHFPLKIDDVQTDVLEGTSHFTSALHIGEKIYNHQEESGTLGGFVKYYGIDTFLTCAHVIFGKENISNLQNNVIHSNCHTIRNGDATNPVNCTLIRHILKYDDTQDTQSEADKNDDTSIDAALVLIQIPNISVNNVPTPGITTTTQGRNEAPVELRIELRGHSVTEPNLAALGLRSKYLNENFIDSDVTYSIAVALSAITGEQERLIGAIRNPRLFLIVPSHVRIDTNCIMYNQFSIQNMDFVEGDSGTCIYAKCTGREEKGCIGMLVGKSTSGEYIVTPMKDILKALGVKP